MEDIYAALANHFNSEATQAEEETVRQFKFNSPNEYRLLKTLWRSEKEINVIDYDTERDLQQVIKRVKDTVRPQVTKVKSISPFIRIAVSIAAVVLIGFFIGNFISPINKDKTVATLIHEVNNSDTVRQVLMSDNSTIWLNKNAELTYQSNFNATSRDVSLKGEAFFEIAPNTALPFIISSDQTQTTVVGTSFNIFSNSDSTIVSVATGKVRVNKIGSESYKYVTPGHTATVTNNIEISETQNANYQSWKTGSFKFDQTPIKQIVHDLNSYYSKPVVLDEGFSISCPITGQFINEDMKTILTTIQVACDFQLTETETKFLIH